MILRFLLVLLLPSITVDAYNILVYSPVYAASHTNFMARIADTLTDAGHNVTFLAPVVDEVWRHQLSVKSTKDVVLVEQDEEMRRYVVPMDANTAVYWEIEVNSSNIDTMFTVFIDSMLQSCSNLMRNREVLEEMKSRKFDVGIFEPLSVCGLGFMHAIGIRKTISATSCVFYEAIIEVLGETIDMNDSPGVRSNYFGNNLKLMEKVENYRIIEGSKRWFLDIFDRETEIYRKHLGEKVPHWQELMTDSSAHFVNSIPYLDYPRATLPKTIPIGGISVDLALLKSSKLTEEWSEILDRRKYTMLISFGSMMKSIDMPKKWRQGILEAIKSEPDATFIWKYESDDLSWAKGVPNIHFSKWVPQTALLNDNRLTAFLTHGGLGSTNEVAHLGKPALMIPVVGDQARNAHMLARHGGAQVFQRWDLGNVEKTKEAIHDILHEEKYQKNAKRLAEMLNNQPTSPKEQLVKYVEFAARFGPFPQMNPNARNLGFIKKNLLDVYCVVYSHYIASVVFFVLVLKLLYHRVTHRKVKHE